MTEPDFIGYPKINVLSLFDGMSCGQLALEKIGLPVKNYYASEIDKYAIEITKKNFPNTIHLGDVTKLDAASLDIDLLIGGSPCQGFSFAGDQLAFDDPRSALFFQFVRILHECNPQYFLLENVRMKKEHLDVITEYLEVEPILINSALVSAQNRQRYYWTNIPGIKQPEDRSIVLRDILEEGVNETFNLSDKANKRCRENPRSRAFKPNQEKSGTLLANQYKQSTDSLYARISKPKQVGTAADIKGHDILKRVYSPDGKSPTLTTMQGGHRQPKVIGGAWRGRYKVDGVRQDHKGSVAGKTQQMLELRQDEKTNTLTTVQKDNVVVSTKPNQINPSKKASGKQPYMQDRVFHTDGKSHALTASFADRTNVGNEDEVYWRKLTPLECERLQTVPDGYTEGVSNTQRYKRLGNGWTVDVVAHIFKFMAEDCKVKIPLNLKTFIKHNPGATFQDYLDELMVEEFIEENSMKAKVLKGPDIGEIR